MQSKNLLLIINLSDPKGVSAVVRKLVLWMSGACIPFVPHSKPHFIFCAGSKYVGVALCCVVCCVPLVFQVKE